jgi:hypothetical protein
MKRVSLILLPCLLVVVLAGLFLRPTFAHGAAASPTTCGKGWTVVPSANRSNYFGNYLSSVAAISANDVWAVGTSAQRFEVIPDVDQSLIEHWNGTAWSIVPDASPTNTYLSGVAAVATNDVWAVGGVDEGEQSSHAIIEHWNGTVWNLVTNPAPNGSELQAVAAISATDVWAVGGDIDAESSLIMHWNGTVWSVVPGPSSPLDLYAVTAVSSTDVWAGGGGGGTSIIEHWNGKNWKVVSSPYESSSFFSAISAVSATDIWAVGFNEGDRYWSFIEHWDGEQWTSVRVGQKESLFAVGAISENNVWAAGLLKTGDSIVHWNGKKWSIVSGPPVPNPVYSAFTVVPGTAQIWGVGTYSSNPHKTLIAFHC